MIKGFVKFKSLLIMLGILLLITTAAAQEGNSTAEIKKKLKALDDAYQAGILSETEYKQKKAQLLDQSALRTDLKSDAPKVRIPTKQGKTYRHPTGFSFWYPANWSTRIEGELLLLVPNDQQVGARGPNDLHRKWGECCRTGYIQRQ
jgi:hypothetical protein